MVLPTSRIQSPKYSMTQLDIYTKYCDEVETLRRSSGPHFNGCRERAKRMLTDFLGEGYNGLIVVVNAAGHSFTHESNAHFYYHDVLFSEGMIYDPNFTRRRPISFQEYPFTVFDAPEDIYIWKKGDPSLPLWRYQKEAA